jgi:hypothetical protein
MYNHSTDIMERHDLNISRTFRNFKWILLSEVI